MGTEDRYTYCVSCKRIAVRHIHKGVWFCESPPDMSSPDVNSYVFLTERVPWCGAKECFDAYAKS